MSKKDKDTRVQPSHPGVILRDDFMSVYGLSAKMLADSLNVSGQTVNEVLRGRRSITPVMALRLSRFFGNEPDFWLNAQHDFDLYKAEEKYKEELNQIQRIIAPKIDRSNPSFSVSTGQKA